MTQPLPSQMTTSDWLPNVREPATARRRLWRQTKKVLLWVSFQFLLLFLYECTTLNIVHVECFHWRNYTLDDSFRSEAVVCCISFWLLCKLSLHANNSYISRFKLQTSYVMCLVMFSLVEFLPPLSGAGDVIDRGCVAVSSSLQQLLVHVLSPSRFILLNTILTWTQKQNSSDAFPKLFDPLSAE